jgi:hypothetical protein
MVHVSLTIINLTFVQRSHLRGYTLASNFEQLLSHLNEKQSLIIQFIDLRLIRKKF